MPFAARKETAREKILKEEEKILESVAEKKGLFKNIWLGDFVLVVWTVYFHFPLTAVSLNPAMKLSS